MSVPTLESLRRRRIRLEQRIGFGGNGVVYAARYRSDVACAIKISTGDHRRSLARFKAEVTALTQLHDIQGVMPLLDSYIPQRASRKDRPWYRMPLGTKLDLADLRGSVEAVRIIADVGDILTKIHERDFSHRDVKPENILIVDGHVVLSDFGLATYRGKPSITRTKEWVGSRSTIAPEMRAASAQADARPADVYALAKTLWILYTGQLAGFEGQYSSRDSTIALRRNSTDHYLSPIEHLLFLATHHDPAARPRVDAFVRGVRKWLAERESFIESCASAWSASVALMFPGMAAPHIVRWTTGEHIATVLRHFARTNLNHCFFGTCGGMDLEGVIWNHASGELELSMAGSVMVRPLFLEMVLWDSHPEWSYLWLSLGMMKPSGSYPQADKELYEEVLRLPDGTMTSVDCAETGVYADSEGRLRPLPSGYRHIVRRWDGPIVMFGKASPYNLTLSGYAGEHAVRGREGFYDFVRERARGVAGTESAGIGA